MPLGKAYLKVLHKDLIPAAQKWEQIGLYLGMDGYKLKEIEHSNPKSLNKCLLGMLDFVLRNKQFEWTDIFEALRSKIVDESNLASELELKHCRGTKRSNHDEADETDGLPAAKRDKYSPEPPVYPMQHKPHGRALIINNREFVRRDKYRHGTNADRDAMSTTLEQLDYDVHVEENVKGVNMQRLIIEHANAVENCDSFVCCIFSHGGEGRVRGSDWVSVSIRDVARELTKVDKLKGKPKIFFIQACRGREKPEVIRTDDEDKEEEEIQEEIEEDSGGLELPRDSDFFYGYATTPETVSIRMTTTGTWYIQELSQVLKSDHNRADLVTMVTKVHQGVATKPQYKYKLTRKVTKVIKGEPTEVEEPYVYRQQPQLVSTLRGPVHF